MIIKQKYSARLDRYVSDRGMYLSFRNGMYEEFIVPSPFADEAGLMETDAPIETDGEGLIARMPGYRLVEFAQAADPEEEPTAAAEPEPASVPDEKQQRIAALEQELAALRQTS